MKHLDDFAVLMDIGSGDKAEYWITFGGHAHCQPRTGLFPGAFGKRHEHNFRKTGES